MDAHAPATRSLFSGGRLVGLAAAGLLAWTALVAALLAPARLPPRIAPPAWRSASALAAAADGADVTDFERRWSNELLASLEDSPLDESAAVTVAELRASLEARDRLAAPRGKAGSRDGGQLRHPQPIAASSTEVPSYDPSKVSELVSAASAAAAATAAAAGGGDGAAALLRDMSSALSKLDSEQQTLHERLATLQPSLGNYNPKDVDALTRAAELATSREAVSGALPNLLRDLRSAVKEQVESGKELKAKLEVQSNLQARASARAGVLRDLVLRRGDTRVKLEASLHLTKGNASRPCSTPGSRPDAAASTRLCDLEPAPALRQVLFSDLTEAVHEAVDAASKGIGVPTKPGIGYDAPPRPAWIAALEELRSASGAELAACDETNRTLSAALLQAESKAAAAAAAAATAATAAAAAAATAVPPATPSANATPPAAVASTPAVSTLSRTTAAAPAPEPAGLAAGAPAAVPLASAVAAPALEAAPIVAERPAVGAIAAEPTAAAGTAEAAAAAALPLFDNAAAGHAVPTSETPAADVAVPAWGA